jgi:peptide/nickel transport system ATP-binding protein
MSAPTEESGGPTGRPVLQIEDLAIAYGRHGRLRPAVNGISLTLGEGEKVAVVGESGSGKTSVATAVLGLLPSTGHVTGGRIDVLGTDIVGASEKEMRHVRGRKVALVPQDPMVSLNPTMRIGHQIAETVRLRGDLPKRSIPAEVFEFLERAGLDNPTLRARQYPHELSGGMRQRALIANALAGRPKIIVADEPTSALDVTVQRHILDHLDELVETTGISLLLITHDLAVASDRADRVVVMQHGRVVETGPAATVLDHPEDPYTKDLIAAAPSLSARVAFSTTQRPELPTPGDDAPAPILRLEAVVKEFYQPAADRRSDRRFRALDGVSLEVPAGQTLALVGESGSGKTTTLRVAMRLETPTSGRVIFAGSDITEMRRAPLRELRRRFQVVYQDPFSSLDPKFTVEESVVEPLVSFRVGTGSSRRERASQLLDQVALPASFLRRHPAELSGGQRQRVAIARALSLGPDLMMLDEPVSALDVSVQAQILDLLKQLQAELGVAYLFITHDLAVVAEVAHRVAVMGGGRIVEEAPTDVVFTAPTSDYTRQLIDAIPGRSHQPVGTAP